MYLEQAYKNEIRKRFAAMNSKEDLVALLNYVKPLLYGKKTIPFELKQITYYANPAVCGKRYKDFIIKKKCGGTRTIHAPKKGLKAIQRCLNIVLLCVFEPHKAANGFVAGKSIVDNAKLHVGNFYVYNIDLKDFFPSIDQARVWKCLQLHPFNLIGDQSQSTTQLGRLVTDHNEKISYRVKEGKLSLIYDKEGNLKKYQSRLRAEVEDNTEKTNAIEPDLYQKARRSKKLLYEDFRRQLEINKPSLTSSSRLQIANIVAALCCTEMIVERIVNNEVQIVKRNVLPQGAPTSPILTNIVCQRLDHLFTGVARRFGCKYTRYADDITFSSLHNIYQKDSAFIRELSRIINEQGFQIKASKTRLQKAEYRQEVTGLVVNEKVNVKRQYVKQLRQWLYLWERYGYEKAAALFSNDYREDKAYTKKTIPSLEFVIKGKLDYLRMVRGTSDKVYQNLNSRFTLLRPKEETTKATEINLSRHRPIDVSNFLTYFKTSEGLKFLTHDYDIPNSIFDRAKVLSIAKNEFETLTKKYSLPQNLFARIKQFAFGNPSEKWWFNKIPYQLNWNSSELIEWSAKNPGIHPIRNDYFNLSMIEPFKRSVEIKAPQLKEIVLSKLAENLGSAFTFFNINDEMFKDLDKANFYTDVDSFERGLGYLFNAIKQRAENSRTLRFEFSRVSDEIGRKRILKIIHVGSTCNKPLDKSELLKGDLLEAEKAFYGICDWTIVSKSPDRTVNKLNILFDITSNINTKEKVDESSIEGFTHILTFHS